ncbi:kinase-like domain-containing protein [Mycena pura]|uniref:Kinase-like domain-containing protein n=1 Tax=Mycena pura TaxID=153505 RepID=A0AAD6V625_9AGAR|nr:kinase-like domain-containing protein [Mycena pura]
MFKLSAAVPAEAVELAQNAAPCSECGDSVVPLSYLTVWGDNSTESQEPYSGTTLVVIDRHPQVLDSGAILSIWYTRNEHVLDCAENLALQDYQGIDPETLNQARPLNLFILPRIETRPGEHTSVKFTTLPDGSFHLEPLGGPAKEFLEPDSYPSALLLTTIRCTHFLGSTVFLVETSFGRKVLKTARPDNEPAFLETVKFLTALPDVDFFIRPTHEVVNDAGLLRGFLMDYHPASSLWHVLRSFHPDGPNPTLPTAHKGEMPTLSATFMCIPWSVKLAWATDVAAAVAWLHSRNMYWGDLKLENIVLCTDGHCRLIDYAPGSFTPTWSPPEKARRQTESPTSEHDVFSLGLVLWALAEEVPKFNREEEYARAILPWRETSQKWYVQMVDQCLRDQPAGRPSARDIYHTLVSYGDDQSTL